GAGYAAVRSAILRSSRGAERRQTRGFARPPERLAKPPETLARRLLPPCDRRKAPPGAPLAAFLQSPWGRASGRRQAMTALIRSGGHRSFIVHTCSPARGQPVVMPADGWLGASRVRLTRPGRGRRIDETGFPASSGETTRPHLRPRPSPLLRPRHVSGDAPRCEQDEPIIGIPPHRSTVFLKEFVLRRGEASPGPYGEEPGAGASRTGEPRRGRAVFRGARLHLRCGRLLRMRRRKAARCNQGRC